MSRRSPVYRATQRRIDFHNPRDERDVRAIRLASCGVSTRTIGLALGLTVGQVSYRLKKGKTRIRDYRNGVSLLGKYVIDHAESPSWDRVIKVVRTHLRKEGL